MTIIDHLKWRYATKKFNPNGKLSLEQVSVLKEAFNLTALSYGLQTLRLVIVEDKVKREPLLANAYGQRQVVDASHLLIICVDTKVDAEDVEDHFKTIKAIRETPNEILDPFKTQLKATIEKMTAEEKRNWTKNQAYIALGNLMTVCALEKIDSCPMEGFNPKQIDAILNLNALNLESVLLLPVGFRAEDDMFASLKKVRKSINETVIEIE